MGNLLVPFKKFLSNKNTITILGVLLGIVVLYFGYTWRISQSIAPISIPYAINALYPGDLVTADDIGYTDVPKDMVKNMGNILTAPAQIQNMLVAYDTKIPQNSFFFSGSLMTAEEMPDSVFSDIKDGYTMFSLGVNNHSTYGNAIFPGDSIDLYLKTTTEEVDENKLVFGRFIKHIEVKAVRDGSGNNVFRDKDNLGAPAELLFAVPEDLFLLLMKAQYLGDFEIVPVPRNDNYTEHAAATEVEAAVLEQMIIEKTFIIPGECTDLTQCG